LPSLFAQLVSGCLGRSVEFRGRRAEKEPLWSLMELQGFLDEWIVACFSGLPKIYMYHDLLFHVADMSVT
jgi:putative transposase